MRQYIHQLDLIFSMPYLIKRLNVRGIVRACIWAYIGSIWIWLTVRLVFFDRIWWLSLLNTNAFYLLVPSLALLPLALKFGHRQEIFSLIIGGLTLPILLLVWFFGYLLVPPQVKSWLTTSSNSSAPKSSSVAFRAMSFNILFHNQKYSKITESIRASNPDLIGLEEVQSHHVKQLKQALTEYPYSAFHPAPKDHNIAFFSRFPIESVTILPESSIERGMSIVVKIQGRSLTVVVAHLTPNYVPPVPFDRYPSLLQQRYDSRATEINYLLQFIRVNPHPAIVLCDCNLTDTSQAYLQMKRGLLDSFAQSGWGLGHTFQGEEWQFPLQRLDYIWHTDRLTGIDAYVGKDGGSDHLPILADFRYLID
jgi:vancomycin resistance protein VanJ